MFLKTFWKLLRQLFRGNMADIRNAVFDSRYKNDEIIRVITGTSSSLTTGNSETIEISNSFMNGWGGLFVGIWSLNGTDWYDIGADKLDGSFVSEWQVSANTDPNTLNIFVWNIRGSTGTVQYKIALLARATQQGASVIQPDEIKRLDTRYNFQKIFYDEESPTTTVAIGTTYTITVPHNFGYVPFVRGFINFQDDNIPSMMHHTYDMGSASSKTSWNVGGDGVTLTPYITADTNNVYFNVKNEVWMGAGLTADVRIFGRVYYE